MKRAIVCIDRDGTLIHDEREHLFLGRDDGWKDKIRILLGVVEGLRLLKTVPGLAAYMITNQPGVAIRDFPLLTLERAHEVCRYMVLRERGGPVDGYFLCPHANAEYAARKPGVRFDEKLLCECHCIKPGLGMVWDALQKEGGTPENSSVYVIGDRASDVGFILNTNGRMSLNG